MTELRKLRLAAVDGKLVGPPPPPPLPPITSVGAALTAMRLSVAIVASEPEDPLGGYSHTELAAQYAAVDRMVQAFRVLDAMLGRHPSVVGVSRNGHPQSPPSPPRKTRNGAKK